METFKANLTIIADGSGHRSIISSSADAVLNSTRVEITLRDGEKFLVEAGAKALCTDHLLEAYGWAQENGVAGAPGAIAVLQPRPGLYKFPMYDRIDLHERAVPVPEEAEKKSCPDDGTCHHGCAASCFRVQTCGPLSGVFPNNIWPAEIVEANRSEG